MGKKLYIGVNIDWSKSFVDSNGSFYCGTTDKQKRLAAKIMPYMDMVIYATDFHSIKGSEFRVNGGAWPLHNVAEFRSINPADYGLHKDTTISPEQTEVIDSRIDKSRAGIVVPKHVYFQDGSKRSFTPDLVEQAFGQKIITPREFLRGNYTYIISPKTHFDATRTVSDLQLPKYYVSDSDILRIPDTDYTVFDLLQLKAEHEACEMVFVNSGVVENICRHYTSTGQKQMFPGSRVINLEGATTELAGIGLGFDDKMQVREACSRISKDIGIEYMTVDNLIAEIESTRSR